MRDAVVCYWLLRIRYFFLIFCLFLNNHVVLITELNIVIFRGVWSFSLIAVGSLISGLTAQIFLQYFEYLKIKHITENNHTIFYNYYVDSILIIYDHIKITSAQILHYVNTIHTNLQFKLTLETDPSFNFLNLSPTEPITASKQKFTEIYVY